MKIYEIDPMASWEYKGGKDSLRFDKNQYYKKIIDNAQPVPENLYNQKKFSNNLKYANVETNSATSVYLVDDIEIIGFISYNYPSMYFPKKAVQVGTVTIDEDYRGKGLGQLLYRLLYFVLKVPIVAGDSQTPNGRKMWRLLSQSPDFKVLGYVRINDKMFNKISNDKRLNILLDEWMNSGGQYLGKDKFKYHYLAFPVESGGKQLRAVQTKVMQIYQNLYNTDPWLTSLVAYKV